MNVAYKGPWPQLSDADALLMDVAQRVQLVVLEMPMARFEGPPRVGNLFHHKPEAGEAYHKKVNPWGFADHFNEHAAYDLAFHDLFKGRRLLVEGELALKAETRGVKMIPKIFYVECGA